MPGLSYLQPLWCRSGANQRKPTMRPVSIYLPTTMAVLLCSLILTACDTKGPEFADGETTSLIESILEVDEVSESHFRAITRAGTVNLEATDISATNAETGEVVNEYILGVSVGLPDPADETRCRVTFSNTLQQGESFSVYSQDGIFCVVVFRPPVQPAGTVVRYLLTLSGAFS